MRTLKIVRRLFSPHRHVAEALALVAAAVSVGVAVMTTATPDKNLAAESVKLHSAPGNGEGDAIATPPVFAFRPVVELEARAINAAIPIDPAAIRPASPFFYDPRAPSGARLAALDCLAAAVHYEAANETLAGQHAVAQVVLNRVRHATYPATICGTVFQGAERATGCQFTFTCDGSLARVPSPAAWLRARGVAANALGGYVERRVGLATHYHADYVVPYWQSGLSKIGPVGSHIFYRWRGSAGQSGAFRKAAVGFDVYPPALLRMLGTRLALPMGDGTLPVTENQPVGGADNRLDPASSEIAPPPLSADLNNRRPIADESPGRLLAD